MKARIAWLASLGIISLFLIVPVGCAGRRNSFLGFMGMAGPEGVDKERLRELAQLPTVSVKFGLGFYTGTGFLMGEGVSAECKSTITAERVALRKVMKGDTSDAEQHFRLWEVSDDLKERNQALDRAIELFRQQLREQPKNARIMARLGRAVEEKDAWEEAEKLLREAVQLAPNEAACWSALGRYLQEKSVQAIGGRGRVGSINAKHLLELAKKGTFDARQAAAAKALLEEALQCHDRAVAFAPDSSEPYWGRIRFWFVHYAMRPALQFVETGRSEPPLPAYPFSREILADLWEIGRLNPDDPRALGLAIASECLRFCMNGDSGKLDYRPGKIWKSLPAETRTWMSEKLARIEKLADAPDKQVAAEACLARATVAIMLHFDFATAKDCFRRALELDPSRESAWDLLIALSSTSEQLKFFQERLKHNDSAHARFLFAKAYADNDQLDKAEEQLRIALEKNPKDFHAALGLAAMRLKLGKDEAALSEASKLLAKAAQATNEKTEQDNQNEYALTRAIYLGLTDKVDEAEKAVNEVLARDEDNKQARKVLSALGK